jgi:CubicO group peptidase (beta-lactamase class C family)
MVDGLEEANVHAVLVVRHGTLVFEHYFSGADERQGRPLGQVAFGPETKHDERSVTKSVTALVLGIAIDRGWVKSVDEPVLSFVTAPGQLYNYSSGSAELLGAVLKKATGKPLDELARTLLFESLGIRDIEWLKYAQGNVSAASSLRLRPRDLAKIGQLVLQRGTWNGTRIVPASWIDAATTPQINGPPLFFYGYQFWLGRSLVNKRAVEWTAAVGLGGQRVFILPALDLVVVINAGLYKSDLQGWLPLAILNRYVLASTEPRP